MAQMRLARYIAQSGVAARRKAEQLIRNGQVMVNGAPVTNVATNVNPSRDQVSVDGQAVVPEPLFYVILNKPKACITSVTDPWDRPTVMDYLPKIPAQIKPVGRLDYYSEGVLLLTNDGALAAALLGPQSHIEKTYHVKVRGRVSDRQLGELRKGVRIGPRTVTREAQVDRLKTKSKHEWLVMTLTEGKSPQIHRMLETLNLTVTKLQRVAFAGLSYHGLRVGDARELTQGEVNDLRRRVGLKRDPAAVSRGAWSARREDTELGRRARARVREEKKANETDAERREPWKKTRQGQGVPRGSHPSKRDDGRKSTRESGGSNRSARPSSGNRSARPSRRRSSSSGKPSTGRRGAARNAGSGKPNGGKKRRRR